MTKPKVVVLHGANSGPNEIEPLSEQLRPFFEVAVPPMLGHAGRPIPESITTGALADDVVAWMQQQGIERAWIVGYSLGGYLALYMARHHPDRVLGVCAIAPKAVFEPNIVKHMVYLASVERLERPGNPRMLQLEKTHAPQDWRNVARLNQRYFEELGRRPPMDAAAFGAIKAPVMLVNANRDQIVPWGETLALGKLIPGSKLVMFYGLAHPIHVVPVVRVAHAFKEWVASISI